MRAASTCMSVIWTKVTLKGKFPQTTMWIGWVESNFTNPTVKVWADLDNPFKRNDYAKLCMSVALSGWNSMNDTFWLLTDSKTLCLYFLHLCKVQRLTPNISETAYFFPQNNVTLSLREFVLWISKRSLKDLIWRKADVRICIYMYMYYMHNYRQFKHAVCELKRFSLIISPSDRKRLYWTEAHRFSQNWHHPTP